MTPSRRTLLTLAIVLPLVAFVLAMALNQLALARETGPQDPAFWLFVFLITQGAIAIGLAFSATSIGTSPWKTMAVAAASALVSFYIVGPLMPDIFAEKTVTVGNRGPRRGGGFTHNVGAKFGEAELNAALASAERLNSAHAFDQFTCGEQAPEFRFEFTLTPQGPDNERYVDVGYTPEVDNVRDRCLSFGVGYLVDSVFFPIDTGPRVKYGYVNPRTGEPLPEEERRPPRKPVCRCDLRGAGTEWVAWSPEAAAALGPDSSRNRP